MHLVSCLLSIGGHRRTTDENKEKDRKQEEESVQREAQFNLVGLRTDRLFEAEQENHGADLVY